MKVSGSIRGADARLLGTVRPCLCPDANAKAFHTAMKARTFGLSGATIVSIGLDEQDAARPRIAIVGRTVGGKNVALVASGLEVFELSKDSVTDADVDAAKKLDPLAGADLAGSLGIGALSELLASIIAAGVDAPRRDGHARTASEPLPAELSATIESKLEVDFEIPPTLTAFMERLDRLVDRVERMKADPPAAAPAPSPETPKV